MKKQQQEITKKAQALYYKLRAEGLNHSEALNGVIAVVFRAALLEEVASSTRKKGPK